MTAWTVPATWANSAVTAAQMNTEIRDHLVWLKNWADLITESTAADTGDTVRLNIIRNLSTVVSLATKVTGDANNRFSLLASGKMSGGNGTLATDTDFTLRSGVNESTHSGRIFAQTFEGTSTTDAFRMPNGYIEINERASDPAAPAANWCRIWCKDNGAGKTQLMARFSSGANVVIATQP
jgi:flagellar basal body L-ring protein FlgH